MKQIYILAIIFFSLNSYSQNCNIGNDEPSSDFAREGGFTTGYLLGGKFTLLKEGTLRSINLIGNDTGEGFRMAVYDDNSGAPNNLIASGTGIVGNGPTSLPVTPTLIPAGDYWIMANYSVGGNTANRSNESTGNKIYYQTLSYNEPLPKNGSKFLNYLGEDFLYFLGIDCGNTLSTEEFNLADKISLFPNPASDFITIYNAEIKENYSIINQLGQKVLTGTISSEKINIKNLNNGLYFLKLGNGNTYKFIKKFANKI